MSRTKDARSRVAVVVPTKMLKMLLEIPVWPNEVQLYAVSRKHGVCGGNIPTDCPVGEYNGYVTWPTEKAKASYFNRKGFDYEAYKRNGCQLSAVLG